MIALADLISYSEGRWPLEMAADWDNPGLALGSRSSRIERVLLSVDVTDAVVEEAEQGGFQLIFSHHPFIFKGLKSLDEDIVKGRVATRCIRAGISIYSAHTNADFAEAGVSQTLARVLGLSSLKPLTREGEGVCGTVEPITLLEFARAAGRALPSCAQGLLVQGDPGRVIRTVGLVAGSGDSYLPHVSGLDLFITSDLRHHPASDHRDLFGSAGVALMSVPHFAAEWPWLLQAKAELEEAFPSVEFAVSEINTDPWDFAVMQ